MTDTSHAQQAGHPSFRHDRFLIRQKVFKLFGEAMHVYDGQMNLLLYIELKAFKLKEDIRVYTDESKSTQVLRIAARRVIDIAATYDVFDTSAPGLEEDVGSLRRRGLKSMVRDKWEIHAPGDLPLGEIQEDSGGLAMLRRIVDIASLILPQEYMFTVEGRSVGTMKRKINPFIMKMEADFSTDTEHRFDRRLAIASAILLTVIEGRQG